MRFYISLDCDLHLSGLRFTSREMADIHLGGLQFTSRRFMEELYFEDE